MRKFGEEKRKWMEIKIKNLIFSKGNFFYRINFLFFSLFSINLYFLYNFSSLLDLNVFDKVLII